MSCIVDVFINSYIVLNVNSLHVSVDIFFRYDPNTDIPMDVEYENDRVLFIKSVAQFMVWLM